MVIRLLPVRNNYYYAGIILFFICGFLLYWGREYQIVVMKISPTTTCDREYILREKLEEAEEIWRQGVTSRHMMELSNPVPDDDPWSLRYGVWIWDFFYPNFNCPHMVERLGRGGDGGKWVCGISHLAEYRKPCLVYSFGVGSDASFEKTLIDRANCTVHLYDHTINLTREGEALGSRTIYGPHGSFAKIGLGFQNSGFMRTLKSEMEYRGDTFIDILKVDVEGGEFEAFRQIVQDFPDQLPFGQLLIELHLTSLPEIGTFRHLKNWWETLENSGLRAFHNEINPYEIHAGLNRCTLYEISFLNIRGNHALLHY